MNRHEIKHWLIDWLTSLLSFFSGGGGGGGGGGTNLSVQCFFFFSLFNEWFEVSLTTLFFWLFYFIFSLAASQLHCSNLVFLEYVSLCAHKLSLFLSLSVSVSVCLSVCLSVSVCLSLSLCLSLSVFLYLCLSLPPMTPPPPPPVFHLSAFFLCLPCSVSLTTLAVIHSLAFYFNWMLA